MNLVEDEPLILAGPALEAIAAKVDEQAKESARITAAEAKNIANTLEGFGIHPAWSDAVGVFVHEGHLCAVFMGARRSMSARIDDRSLLRLQRTEGLAGVLDELLRQMRAECGPSNPLLVDIERFWRRALRWFRGH